MSLVSSALLTAIGLLAIAWLIHFGIWKIRVPTAYPYWIPGIFLFVFVVYCALVLGAADYSRTSNVAFLIALVVVPYGLMAMTYFMAYAGIIEYSPSMEILLEIESHMPDGIERAHLKVRTLPEEMLTGLRIKHLLDAGLIVETNEMYQATAKGRRFGTLLARYRSFFWICSPGEG